MFTQNRPNAFVEQQMARLWAKAKSGRAIYQNIEDYNLAVMKDHNEETKWTWCLNRKNSKLGEWSPTKYTTEDDAKRAGLERLDDVIQGTSGIAKTY